ncbi:T9SS type A sorting domain-containing protein [Flavobacterium sp. SUN046]|uniref:T9SS type A sorting domain-containing protein n=1 Tax=Flavobacterium sp. SUN046 TaxID=3002440 RepID=UPI002DB67CB8|nr:T9SS type A sorting domain-containing protein [Flavobacterium sp. SUN046]MEC4051115.1 T9SS type A sorting domain-containing protein [Flavobacterium sp. SUN046]
MKKLIYLLLSALAPGIMYSQISTFPSSESFDTAFTEGTSVSFIPNWTGNIVAPPSSKIFRDITDYNSAPAALSIIPTSSFNGDVEVNLNLSSYQSIVVNFVAKSMLNGAGTRDAVLSMSTSIDGGTTWIGTSQIASLPNSNQTAFTNYSYPLPIEANNQSNVLVRFYVTRGSTGTSTAAKLVIDDVTIQQTSTPQIVLNQTSMAFTQVLGVPSQTQIVTVSGSNLNGNINLAAPSNFEISLAQNSAFSNTLNLTPTNGIVSSTVYVRLNSSINGIFNGNLTVNSLNTTVQNIALTGNCVTPTVTNPNPIILTEGVPSLVFDQWDNANTAGSHPQNLALWTHSTSDPDLNTLFIEDWSCMYNLTSRSRFAGEGANGISMVNTGNAQFVGICDGSDPTQTTGNTIANGRAGAVVMGLDTSSISNSSTITINWTGRTILKNLRAYGLRMQYRIGTSNGNPNSGWLEFPTTEEYLSGEDNTSENKSTQLPQNCNGQSLVQIRWVYYYISGSGARAQLGLDDINVSIATLGNQSFTYNQNDFSLSPNPVSKEIVYLSSKQDIEIFDILGNALQTINNATSINTTTLSSGIYLIKSSTGITKKLIVK